MADDRLRDLVSSSAGRPAGDAPMGRILGLARRRRLTRRLTVAAVPLAGLLVAGVVVLAALPQGRVEFAPADPGQEPEGEEQPEPDPGEPATEPDEAEPTRATATPTEPATEPDAEPTATPTPTAEEGPPELAPPEAVLVTDGQVVALREVATGAPAWDVEVDAGEEVLAVAVRPGSTVDELDAVYVVAGEDGFDLGWLTVAGGAEPEVRRGVEGAATVMGDAAPATEPWPVWSPDGSALAWVELPADETAPGARLRLAAWEPQERVAVDDGAVDLEELPLQPIRAETLTEPYEGDGVAEGELELYLSSSTLEAWRVGLVRSEEGWELTEPGVLLTETPSGGMPVAIGRDAGPGAAYFLAALDASDDGTVPLDLFDAAGHQGLPLADEAATADPASAWIAGGGDHVLVGDGERAWVTSRPGGLRQPLDGTVRHGDWVD